MNSNPSSLIYSLDEIVKKNLSALKMSPDLPFKTATQLNQEHRLDIWDDYFHWLGCIDLTKLDGDGGRYLYYFLGTTLCKDISECDFSEVHHLLLRYREKYKYLFVLASHTIDRHYHQTISLVTMRPNFCGIGYPTNTLGLDPRGVRWIHQTFCVREPSYRKNFILHRKGIISPPHQGMYPKIR